MRDLIVAGICVLGIPLSLIQPFVGLLFYYWMSYFRPQDLAWGFAQTTPWSKFIAVCMLIGILLKPKEKMFKISVLSFGMILLWIFDTIAVIFSINQEVSLVKYQLNTKIFFITLVTIGMVNSEQRIKWLMIVIMASLGFHGVKGAILGTLFHGGHVSQGPGGMIVDNNQFALALLMAFPVYYYLGEKEKNIKLKLVYWGTTSLNAICILWTHSRGGLLGLCSVLFFITWTWKNKLWAVVFWALAPVVFYLIAPASLLNRYATMEEYQKDESAMSRFHSWKTAYNMGVARPFTGVGPGNMVEAYWDYAPPFETSMRFTSHVAHNVYLQLLANAGFPIVITYVSLLIYTFWNMFFLRIKIKKYEFLEWCRPYTYAIQYSIVGFCVSGTFLSVPHFDLIYQMMAIGTCLKILCYKDIKKYNEEQKEKKKKKNKTLKEPKQNKINKTNGEIIFQQQNAKLAKKIIKPSELKKKNLEDKKEKVYTVGFQVFPKISKE